MSKLKSVLEGYESNVAARKNNEGTFWCVEFTQKDSEFFERCCADLLQTLVDSKLDLFIHITDSPVDEEVTGEWECLMKNVWKFPKNVDVSEKTLISWLNYGNWRLYPADNPLSAHQPDLARVSVEEGLRFVKEAQFGAVIDSFHDNDSWTVVLGAF